MLHRWTRAAAAALPALLALAVPAAAQQPGETLSGRVLLRGEPVAGAPVALHRVTPDESGEVGAAVTDEQGRFRIPVPPADSAGFTVYFATASYADVRYFGRPLHPGEAAGDYTVAVFDTTSAAAGRVRLARRDLVLIPGGTGGWEVNEVVSLTNTGDLTLVPGSDVPSWSLRLPEGATDFEVGESDLAADQVRQVGDRVMLLAPLVPGTRDLFLRYRIPAGEGRAALRLGLPADSMRVYVQQPAPRTEVQGLRPSDLITVEGQRFLQFAGGGLEPDARIELQWESSAPPVSPVLAGVGVAALVLGLGSAAALRSRPAGAPRR